jgi:hypothetical protein
MAAKVNLIRDARVFFTTNVNAVTGKVSTGAGDSPNPAFSVTNLFELQTLDGLTFSQSTGTETVTMNEAGDAPVRGQRVYNTSIEPANFSFSTYLRPAIISTATDCEEAMLWNALASDKKVGDPGDAWTPGTPGSAKAKLVFTNSDKNQLQKFGIIICMKANTIVMNNACLESATIDFGIDAIATVAWAGMATEIEYRDAVVFGTLTGSSGGSQALTSGGLGVGAARFKITDGKYLANKLSIAKITYPVGGSTVYTIPITGGNIGVTNNTTYLTPATIGIVNKPLTSFTGARAFSGNLTAYLRASAGETGETGDLVQALTTAAANTDQLVAKVEVSMGAASTSNLAPHVVFTASTALLSIPDVNTDQIVGVTLNFTPHGSTDITDTNELEIEYFHPTA